MDPAAYVDGLVHEPTQISPDSVDLTVADIHELTAPGQIDFGGGEFAPAQHTSSDRTYHNPDDQYQWWHLDPGTYLIEYNESLDAPIPLVLQPRQVLFDCGVSHPTVRVETLPRVPLTVGDAGARIKENARVSTLTVP